MSKRDVVPGLGEKLKAARDSKQFTQAEAASASGVFQGNISLFEAEEKTPTLATLYKLAAAYGVKVADLLPDGEQDGQSVKLVPDPEPIATKKPKPKK